MKFIAGMDFIIVILTEISGILTEISFQVMKYHVNTTLNEMSAHAHEQTNKFVMNKGKIFVLLQIRFVF